MPVETPSTVFYNSACPVCNAGIGLQRQQMAQCDVNWVDVHTHPERAQELGVDLEFLRERLHVMDGHGQLQVGAAAVSSLMLQTPWQRWLGRIAQWPVLRNLLALAYNVFAKLLYRWNLRRGHWQPKP